MRILISTATGGGVWRHGMDLAQGLRPLGVDVILATMGGPLSAAQKRRVAAFPNVQLHQSGFAMEWMAEPWEDVNRAGDWLMELERAFPVDVVHLSSLAHADLPFRAPVLAEGQCGMFNGHDGAAGETYRLRVGRGLRAARLVVAPAPGVLRQLERRFGPLDRTVVIPRRWRSLGRSCGTSATAIDGLVSMVRRYMAVYRLLIASSEAQAAPWTAAVTGRIGWQGVAPAAVPLAGGVA